MNTAAPAARISGCSKASRCALCKCRIQCGEQRARALGVGPEEVSPLVEEYRAEVGFSRK